ncbi:MAG: hypothetical protein COY80_04445 [Candidatus Pacebacteria bacterium CG_4_10_14_0_8_um_filter_42_14]|nr:MAG: hypothetical protein COY80_04445 [Candidatus Pacebacteria bacterium CG_4_10_14_0_8_um_filter_42_14]
MRERRNSESDWRGRLVILGIFSALFIVGCRLFYWQVIASPSLKSLASRQYEQVLSKTGSRGSLYFSDGSLLVGNERVYRLFAEPQLLPDDRSDVAKKLAQIVLNSDPEFETASPSAQEERLSLVSQTFEQKLNDDKQWVGLKEKISEQTRQAIEQLKLPGIGFDTYEQRLYPEASAAAHITGFVGKTDEGEPIGYFGIEGALEQELRPRIARDLIGRDALGAKIFTQATQQQVLDGRDITTTLRRDLQLMVERELLKGVEKYGAKAGEAIVVDPKTGKIRALAAVPSFYQPKFIDFDSEVYRNPTLGSLYEPGSTFKILTVAAGLDAGAIDPETQCDVCDGPRRFGTYTIRTWNDVYHPNTTMRDGLAASDNTAMMFIVDKLGAENFEDYLHKFGIGDALNIDLQGDTDTIFPKDWRPVELATRSFGQGISISSLQLVRAVSAIANGGEMPALSIIESAYDPATNTTHVTNPGENRRVISPETARTLTEMLVYAAQHGEAQWVFKDTYPIAGKTGTSQVASSGGYEEDATIASFIGFAPPENPDFLLFIKLTEPTTSPWAAETAAPLWHTIAEQIAVSW